MEFYSPIKNNIKVMPGNDDIVNDQTVFPSDEHIERVLNNPRKHGYVPFHRWTTERNPLLDGTTR